MRFKDDTKNILTGISINVQVSLINNIEILGMIQRRLYVGAVIRLIALS